MNIQDSYNELLAYGYAKEFIDWFLKTGIEFPKIKKKEAEDDE